MRHFCLLLLLLAPSRAFCDDEEELELADEEEASDHCVVSTKRGIPKVRASVTDETSIVKSGLLGSKAWLDDDVVRAKGPLWSPRIGRIDDDVAVFGRGPLAYKSQPISGSTVVVKPGLGKMTFTSSGCTRRQLALGAVHLMHLLQAQQQAASNQGGR